MKYFILLLTTCVFIASCSVCSSKQVTCPAFEDELFTAWFPYKQEQQLIFSSPASNDTFQISKASRSGSYHDTVTAQSPYCMAEASFTTSNLNPALMPPFGIWFNISHNEFANETSKLISIKIKDGSFGARELSDTGLVNDFSGYLRTHFQLTDTVAGNAYNDIQEVYIDTTIKAFKLNEVYKFWLAKNQGIVAYEEYHGNLHVKQ